jgi:MFS family permease
MYADQGIAPNAKRLLWAGFMAILAAGIGFGVRGGILLDWKGEFSFTDQQLGEIAGAGLTGFCVGIFIGGLVVDRLGYGKLVIAAFLFHCLSALVTFAADPSQSMMTAYNYLFWGTFIFAIANGTLEAVANPLVSTLFPHKRTHYLNILHASWPAGLVLGGMIGWIFGGEGGWHWKYQLALFLLPTLVYGLMFFGQAMPKSEASQQGLSLGSMFRDVGLLGGLVACALLALFFKNSVGPMLGLITGSTSEDSIFSSGSFWFVSIAAAGALWCGIAAITKGSLGHFLLFVLFIAHALIGAVELGTDTWAQNITGNLLTPTEGKILFVFTSSIMFLLRFCADWIESKLGLSPVGILLSCAILACLGLLLTSRIETFVGALAALSIYAVGKTFFWPTMLAIAGDRFPRTGAIAMSMMGGIGMMSGGLLGAVGLGYAKDRFSSEHLRQNQPAMVAEYKAEKSSKFLFFEEARGLDAAKLTEAQKRLSEVKKNFADAPDANAKAMQQLSETDRSLIESSIAGDRKTLVADAFIPGTLAVIFLGILLYFKSIGGYRPLKLHES